MEGRMSELLQIYQADGLHLIVPITFAPGSGVSTLIGGTAEVHVQAPNGAAIAGLATITGAAEVTAVFPPWALDPADYILQLRAAPPATAMQTIEIDGADDLHLRVRRSIRPAP
jgi:hypothetical protein